MFVFFIAAMIFWAIFEQAGITIALFGRQLTRTELFGWPFPVGLVPVAQLAVRHPAGAAVRAALWLRLGAHSRRAR